MRGPAARASTRSRYCRVCRPSTACGRCRWFRRSSKSSGFGWFGRGVAKNGPPNFDAELVQLNARPAGSGEPGERDELFNKGVEIVLASQRGSVSLLQRRLSVGYSRASRIIDQMAEAGLLGDYKGSQARECNITLEDWREMQASIAADQSGASSLNGEPTSA